MRNNTLADSPGLRVYPENIGFAGVFPFRINAPRALKIDLRDFFRVFFGLPRLMCASRIGTI